jgi:hypothetical protein
LLCTTQNTCHPELVKNLFYAITVPEKKGNDTLTEIVIARRNDEAMTVAKVLSLRFFGCLSIL